MTKINHSGINSLQTDEQNAIGVHVKVVLLFGKNNSALHWSWPSTLKRFTDKWFPNRSTTIFRKKRTLIRHPTSTRGLSHGSREDQTQRKMPDPKQLAPQELPVRGPRITQVVKNRHSVFSHSGGVESETVMTAKIQLVALVRYHGRTTKVLWVQIVYWCLCVLAVCASVCVCLSVSVCVSRCL